MVPENAQQLYQFVKKHSIKRVLDLGTGIGCSAAVVSLALKEKGEEYHIDGLEQYDKCIKIAESLIPEELRTNLKIHQSNPKTWQTEKIPHQTFSVYETVPDLEYDLIVNDGPSPFMEGEHYIDLPNGTITKMLLEGKIKPGAFVIWDGRIQALKVLERFFSDNFYAVEPDRRTDLNILERKNNEPKFGDVSLENMKFNSSYFKGRDEIK